MYEVSLSFCVYLLVCNYILVETLMIVFKLSKEGNLLTFEVAHTKAVFKPLSL